MTIDLLLRELGRRIGLPDLDFGPGGEVRLEIDGLAVDLTRGPGGEVLLVSALAGELPAGDEAGAALRLLAANALFSQTDGATLGVPAGSSAVVLARELAAGSLDAAALETVLDRFTATALAVPALLRAKPMADRPAAHEDFLNMTRV
jgi:hypothetical protein